MSDDVSVWTVPRALVKWTLTNPELGKLRQLHDFVHIIFVIHEVEFDGAERAVLVASHKLSSRVFAQCLNKFLVLLHTIRLQLFLILCHNGRRRRVAGAHRWRLNFQQKTKNH